MRKPYSISGLGKIHTRVAREVQRRKKAKPGIGHNSGAAEAPLPIEPVTLRVPQTARFLNISVRTVWKLIGEGEFEVVRKGPRITLVLIASIRAFLARLAAAHAPPPPRRARRRRRTTETQSTATP